jgi:hypothetical protein
MLEWMKRKSGWKIGVLVLGLGLSLAEAAPAKTEPAMTISSAINKAGRQRMLSQRIVKAYCQIGLKVLPGKSTAILDNSVKLFDEQLAELKQFSQKPELQEALAKEAALWAEMRAVAVAPVSQEGARKLTGLSEGVLQAAQKVTQLLETESGSKAGRLVNLAGRQRMLSQRLAKFYMLKKWGFNQPEIASGIEQARKEFVSALQELVTAPQNTAEIKEELEQARVQWGFFEIALERQDEGDSLKSITNVATTSERILETMNNVTALYEKVEGR